MFDWDLNTFVYEEKTKNKVWNKFETGSYHLSLVHNSGLNFKSQLTWNFTGLLSSHPLLESPNMVKNYGKSKILKTNFFVRKMFSLNSHFFLPDTHT